MHTASTASLSLRRVLTIDAVASGGMGLLLALDAEALVPLLGLPLPLLRWAGLFLIPFAAMLVALAPRAGSGPYRTVTWVVVAGNVLWSLSSAALLVSGLVAPTLLGETFVLGQGIAVGAFAYLELRALRGERRGGALGTAA